MPTPGSGSSTAAMRRVVSAWALSRALNLGATLGCRQAARVARQVASGLHLAPMAQPAKAVLWVDDEAELLEPHRMFLQDKGFEVATATNADDAVEMVRRRPFNLVLLDEQMPGKHGLDAL